MTKYWDFLHTTEKVAMENKGKKKKKKRLFKMHIFEYELLFQNMPDINKFDRRVYKIRKKVMLYNSK